jgi:hypothetical protein
MSRENEILKRFADIVALAGIRGDIDDDGDMYITGFNLDEGRSQMVYVRALPDAVKDQDAVCIYSPCRRVKKGLLRGLSKDQGLELLKLNSDILFARYGILESDDEILVMASIDVFVDTLDPEEVEAAFMFVALAADKYERRFGGDEF